MGAEKKHILFIVNPISGVGKQKGIEQLIARELDRSKYTYAVAFTEGPGHAVTLCREAALSGTDVVVAIGGDGTVNETATGILGTETALGIIPTGSGNGLSRHLKIPMNSKKAIGIINQGKIKKIDTATINDTFFVNIAGVGFDASVAKKFALSERRGFATYLQITSNTYKDYKPRKYTLAIDGETITRKALLVSFANSNQWGNNITINPGARLDDGYIDVCIVQKVPFLKTIFMAPLLFLKRFDRTSYVEIIRAKEVQLIRKKGKSVQVDGDPKKMGKELNVKILPLSLSVIVP